jgi:hypothetical protein
MNPAPGVAVASRDAIAGWKRRPRRQATASGSVTRCSCWRQKAAIFAWLTGPGGRLLPVMRYFRVVAPTPAPCAQSGQRQPVTAWMVLSLVRRSRQAAGAMRARHERASPSDSDAIVVLDGFSMVRELHFTCCVRGVQRSSPAVPPAFNISPRKPETPGLSRPYFRP